MDASVKYLQSIGALTSTDGYNGERVTPLGRMLSMLPVDLPIGRLLILSMVFAAAKSTDSNRSRGVHERALTIAAALSVQSPFDAHGRNAMEKQMRRQKFISAMGDPFTIERVFYAWREQLSTKPTSRKRKSEARDGESGRSQRVRKGKKWCRHYGIQQQRLVEMEKLIRQFDRICRTYTRQQQLPETRENRPHSSTRARPNESTESSLNDEILRLIVCGALYVTAALRGVQFPTRLLSHFGLFCG